MRVYFDTNVVLDVFTRRLPFYDDSARVWGMAERGRIRGLVSAVSVTTLFYVVRKHRSRAVAMEMLGAVRACVGLAPCDSGILERAIDAGFDDFEDAVQFFSAKASGADVLLTRNLDHFPVSDLPVLTPTAFLASGVWE